MDQKGPNNGRGLTYAQAGVDIDAGNRMVEMIKPLVRATRRPGADAEIGRDVSEHRRDVRRKHWGLSDDGAIQVIHMPAAFVEPRPTVTVFEASIWLA